MEDNLIVGELKFIEFNDSNLSNVCCQEGGE